MVAPRPGAGTLSASMAMVTVAPEDAGAAPRRSTPLGVAVDVTVGVRVRVAVTVGVA